METTYPGSYPQTDRVPLAHEREASKWAPPSLYMMGLRAYPRLCAILDGMAHNRRLLASVPAIVSKPHDAGQKKDGEIL